MAERQPMTSEQRKEIAKRRREKAAAAALEPELAAIAEDPVPEQKIGGTKAPKRKTGPSVADLRMKGRERETFAKTPTLIAQSMDSCRELMMRLVWGKSQGQLRDSWNPERLSAKAEVARAQKKTPAPAPAASPDAATVKESAAYWNKRKAAEGIDADRGPLCRIKALRAHVPTEAMEMRMRKGDTLVVKKEELDGEPGWVFATKGGDAGYVPRACLVGDSSPDRSVSFSSTAA